MSKAEKMARRSVVIFCCGCGVDIEARLITGAEAYPHRKDLRSLPFWKCDNCGSFVGCHHKTADRTKPLGVIPTDEIKQVRKLIHKTIDPLWKENKIRRGRLYALLGRVIGREYHTADIRSLEEADRVLTAARDIAFSLSVAESAGSPMTLAESIS